LKPLHVVVFDAWPNDWQQYVEVGDEMVIGKYYKQSGWAKTSFVLVKDHGSTFIYLHIIMASKFPMIQKSHHRKGDFTMYSFMQSSYE
jgi:hypothetical protein